MFYLLFCKLSESLPASRDSFFTICVAQRLKRLPGMRETRVRSLRWEDPLEKEMATHSSPLAWRIPWREEPGRLQSMGSQRVGHDWATSLTHSLTHSQDLWNIPEAAWLSSIVVRFFSFCCHRCNLRSHCATGATVWLFWETIKMNSRQ